MSSRGLFIVFEGCDGTGKTTMIQRLQHVLEQQGLEVVSTREPGGTPIGERIRDVLLDRRNEAMCMRTEALLYAASRAQIVDQVIEPALADGKAVICQRYFYSSVAYQGVAGGLGDFVRSLNAWATDSLLPDLVILLDMDPEASLGRHTLEQDRIESRDVRYHRAVRNAFLDMAAAEPERFVVVDASQRPDAVYSTIEEPVRKILAKRWENKWQGSGSVT